MGWKTDFHQAVCDYINKIGNLNPKAEVVTDVTDFPHAVENSLGYPDIDYECDITYYTGDGKPHVYHYLGTFNGLIGNLTDT